MWRHLRNADCSDTVWPVTPIEACVVAAVNYVRKGDTLHVPEEIEFSPHWRLNSQDFFSESNIHAHKLKLISEIRVTESRRDLYITVTDNREHINIPYYWEWKNFSNVNLILFESIFIVKCETPLSRRRNFPTRTQTPRAESN